MSNENRDGESSKGWAHSAVVLPRRHQLRVDFSERNAAVLDLARACDDFDVHMVHLPIGDYFIDSGVVVERKTYADFATSLIDGRLFPQAAALARSPHRPVVLLEGPKPVRMPDVHPHALKGAIVSLAVMWRLPVLHARDPEDSLRIRRNTSSRSGVAWRLVVGDVLLACSRRSKPLTEAYYMSPQTLGEARPFSACLQPLNPIDVH